MRNNYLCGLSCRLCVETVDKYILSHDPNAGFRGLCSRHGNGEGGDVLVQPVESYCSNSWDIGVCVLRAQLLTSAFLPPPLTMHTAWKITHWNPPALMLSIQGNQSYKVEGTATHVRIKTQVGKLSTPWYTSYVVDGFFNSVTLQTRLIARIMPSSNVWDYLQKFGKSKETRKDKCASPESNRGPNDGNVEFYH